jgi:hypothetical protein
MFGFLFGLIGLILIVQLALILLLIFVSGVRKTIADSFVSNKATIQYATRIYTIVCLLLAIGAFVDLQWSSPSLSNSNGKSSSKSGDDHSMLDYYQSQRNLVLSLVSPVLFL